MGLDDSLMQALVGLLEEDRDTFVPARLSILVYLFFTQSARFTDLQKTLKLTSGNLSSHLSKLESLELIRISKRFVELKPTTIVSITQEGSEKVRGQLLRMRELVLMAVGQDLAKPDTSSEEARATTE
ncbi:MAG: transcriptional regulator [Candidatus Thorarchaeota archaeon]|nr:MAG: transcriptional regulator [Candidatus Thorarchaeota archaeon]